MTSGIGISSPLERDPSDGFFKATKTSLETARSNLRNLLLTVKGERLMQPRFGVHPRRMLFENRFDAEAYKAELAMQVATYLPYISIKEIAITTSEEDESLSPHVVKIKIWFSLRDYDDIDDFLTLLYG